MLKSIHASVLFEPSKIKSIFEIDKKPCDINKIDVSILFKLLTKTRISPKLVYFYDQTIYIFLESWTNIPKLMCYGSAGNSYASFRAPSMGKIEAIKLTHMSGVVSCVGTLPHIRWGCNSPWYTRRMFQTVVTDSQDNLIFPSSLQTAPYIHFYEIPAVDCDTAKEIIIRSDTPHMVKHGEELQIWYIQDLLNASEDNNNYDVRHCVKVSLKYC